MRRFRFQDLRHTFASRLASRGVSLQVIARALGHTTVQMSERYARPSQASLEAVRAALNLDAANSERELQAAAAAGSATPEGAIAAPESLRWCAR